ncbi:indole-3-glycerol phosphate synthase TrpC [Laedolimicola intestinihominis]|uniref:Indole-3-glycerol phosphate synthase n=1 Tax=Laedolimicola intestinihominis TaxID=3133166 RepID=A0ABV1FJ86_9FIRM
MNILEEIAGKTRERIEEEKRRCSPAEMKGLAEELLRSKKHGGAGALTGADNAAAGGCFYRALAVPGMSYICEVKKASPSKGLIAPDFPYLEIAKEYEAAGASAISCLTEPFYFRGADQYLKEITGSARIPVLRKDFTVDEYMIYQAKTLGASAVLLICAILDKVQLRDYRQLAESLGLDALVEAHDETEVEMALDVGAKIVGVNNRDLKTFQVDMQNSIRLRNLAPREVLFVSESGIKGPEEISILREHQVDAVLIGETLMRSTDKKAELERLNGSPLKR